MKSCLLLLCSLFLLAPPAAAAASPWKDWNTLYSAIRDEQIAPAAARARAREIHERMLAAGKGLGSPREVFPLAGYGPECGEQGRNYHLGQFDLYDNTKRKGLHPAHDLFIRDEDQDGLDDATGRPVTVVSFSDGVVVATYTHWQRGQNIYGGNYVWVYDPRTDRFCYYAHLASVRVRPGDRVQAGQVLGTVGRTGKNAFPARSPTHLHFMVVAWDRGRMTPQNPWRELLAARTLAAGSSGKARP